MKKPLSITFVLPFVSITGGIKILFEHANRLVDYGHKVTIVYPGKLFHGTHYETTNQHWQWRYVEAPLRSLKYWLTVDLLGQTEARWFPLDRRIKIHRTPDLSARYLPNADIVIATANETVDYVVAYPKEKGLGVYFAQDYETWSRPEKYVDQTFQNELHLITIGSWQKKLFEERFGRTVEAVIPDGVDTSRFYPAQTTRQSTGLRILMNYHHLAYKGIADGIAAYMGVKADGLPVTLVMFGVHSLRNDMPKETEYHQNVSEADLPDLYRSCDIFLWPTHREGFGLPPMEAMACGLPVVGTKAGAMADYMSDGKTGFMVDIKQPKRLAEKLKRLISDQSLRRQMAEAAVKAMKQWDWSKQSEKLEQYLYSLAEETR